jgi:replicative DNA helicase
MDGLGLEAAELAMLSSVWITQDAGMIQCLDERDFVDEFHQRLLAHLQALVRAGEPLDGVSLIRRLRADRELSDGDRADIFAVLQSAPTPLHKDYYYRVLREERARRYIHKFCDDAKARNISHPNDPQGTLQWIKDCASEAIAKLAPTEGSEACTSSPPPTNTATRGSTAAGTGSN